MRKPFILPRLTHLSTTTFNVAGIANLWAKTIVPTILFISDDGRVNNLRVDNLVYLFNPNLDDGYNPVMGSILLQSLTANQVVFKFRIDNNFTAISPKNTALQIAEIRFNLIGIDNVSISLNTAGSPGEKSFCRVSDRIIIGDRRITVETDNTSGDRLQPGRFDEFLLALNFERNHCNLFSAIAGRRNVELILKDFEFGTADATQPNPNAISYQPCTFWH